MNSLSKVLVACLTVGCSMVQADLIGEWDLNESAGVFADSAGPVISNGTNSGAVGYSSFGVPAGTYGSLQMSASTGTSIDVPFNASVFLGSSVGSDLNRTGGFTVMGWVNPRQNTGRHMMFATGAGGENGWKVGFFDSQLRFTANGVIDQTVPGGAFSLTANQWVHIAVSVAGTTGPRTTRYYVNGDEVHQNTISDIRLSTSPNMMIGNNGEEDPGTAGGTSFSENFDGLIDELKYYDTVLNRNEVINAAVPEPGSGTMLAFGCLMIFAMRRIMVR